MHMHVVLTHTRATPLANMTPRDVCIMCACLLSVLGLSGNKLGDAAATSLAEALASNFTLRRWLTAPSPAAST